MIAPANLICFSEKENFFEENFWYFCFVLIASILYKAFRPFGVATLSHYNRDVIVGDIDEECVDVNACSYAKLSSEFEAVERRIGYKDNVLHFSNEQNVKLIINLVVMYGIVLIFDFMENIFVFTRLVVKEIFMITWIFEEIVVPLLLVVLLLLNMVKKVGMILSIQ